MEEENNNHKLKYISLLEAARLCSYSEPYLRLRARAGKLKSIKLGKKWMTTASWLDDYQARIQEWNEQRAAKKENANVAAFVAAPGEIIGNLVSEDLPSVAVAQIEREPELLPDTVELKSIPAAFCAAEEKILPPPFPKRLNVFSASGQIFPVPKETNPDITNFGWLGALLSGAVCALALFLVFSYGNISNIADFPFGMAGQANTSQAVSLIDYSDGATKKTVADLTSQFFNANSLKDLVDSITSFLGGK